MLWTPVWAHKEFSLIDIHDLDGVDQWISLVEIRKSLHVEIHLRTTLHPSVKAWTRNNTLELTAVWSPRVWVQEKMSHQSLHDKFESDCSTVLPISMIEWFFSFSDTILLRSDWQETLAMDSLSKNDYIDVHMINVSKEPKVPCHVLKTPIVKIPYSLVMLEDGTIRKHCYTVSLLVYIAGVN